MGLWIALLWLISMSLSPALAQLYRWTDATGKVHITDHPETIPPASRARSSAPETPASPPEAPASDTSVDAPTVVPPPPRRPPATAAVPAPAQRPPSVVTSQMQALQEQIDAARRERQTYLAQLGRERSVHVMPWFVKQRRQIAETGHALLTVEKQLDTLSAALEQAQEQQRADQESPPAPRAIIVDTQGHVVYWQRRLTEARDRLNQAKAQRREILDRLNTVTAGEERTVQRQGRIILQQNNILLQVEEEIDAAEMALQSAQQEARQAGAPAEWLR